MIEFREMYYSYLMHVVNSDYDAFIYIIHTTHVP
jgi:hypothetical protein